MAIDMFIKIDNIKGESQDDAHKGETDVLSWSFGASQSGSMHIGGGGGSGKVNVNDLSFVKWVDKGSTDLMLACCKGTHLKKAVLVCRKAGDTPLEYLTITMEDLLVSSYSTGGSGGEDKLTENVSLNFAKIKIDYIEQKQDGSAGEKPKMAWNIQSNVTY